MGRIQRAKVTVLDGDLLEACAAVVIDPGLARICAYLQDDARRGYMTEDLSARLYGHARSSVRSPDSTRFRRELILSREGIKIGEVPRERLSETRP